MPDRILIIKLGALGDVINTLPLAVALKQELGCSIDWLVAPLSFPLVAGHPCVDRAICFNKKKGLDSVLDAARQIRETRYDVTLDLQRILKSGLFAMAARTRRRLGFDRARCKEMSWIFPFERIPPSDPHAHMLTQYLEFGAALGAFPKNVDWQIQGTSDPFPGLPESYAVLNIGATKPANQWKPEYFAALAGEVFQTLDLVPVLTGGREDMVKAVRIMDMAGTRIFDLTGRTTLPQLVHVIGNASCVVSCDTGPMHLASALGIPLVALFGPSNPSRTGPYSGRVVKNPLSCSPCNRKHCIEPRCMETILPGDVLDALLDELKTPSR
ncbi:MAG: glycosyltransferase family 9 protein [Pseudomonadota bacterium]